MKIRASNEIYGIQILRGIASLSVVFHHVLEESSGAKYPFSPEWLTTSAASGVDIFFVISGFIMLHTTFRSGRAPLSPGTFLLRRASRIYPLYWVCCGLMLSLMLAGFMRHRLIGPTDLILSLALLPSSALVIGVSWSLVYEACFYIVFAGSLFFQSARTSVAVTTGVIVCAVIAGGRLGATVLSGFFSNPIPIEFAIGLWIALWQSQRSAAGRPWPISALWAAPAFAALALAPLFVAHPNTNGLTGWPRILAWGLPSALIVAAVARPGAPSGRIARSLVFLGDASYALYLTHPFVMIAYAVLLHNRVFSAAPQVAIAPLIALLAVVVGVGAHVTIEKPLMGLVRHATRRLTRA